MLDPSDNLKRGRRRLEEIREISIIDDWSWDTYTERYFIHFSIELDQQYTRVPKVTEWYIVADASYPFGDISIYPSYENGITCTFPHQLNNYSISKNGLWRHGKLCVDLDMHMLGISAPEREPSTVDERLFWNVKRAVVWLYNAARSELMCKGDYFELPDYSEKCNEIFAFNEDGVSKMQWEDTEHNYGIAKVQYKQLGPSHSLASVQSFLSADEKESISIPSWGDFISSESCDKVADALWIKLDSPLAVNCWQAPMTFIELLDACRLQGVAFIDILKIFAKKARDGKRHLILFGFPIPKHLGEPAAEMVWQALKLPVLSYEKRTNNKFQSGKKKNYIYHCHGVQPGYTPGEKGWWNNDISTILTNGMPLDWVYSQNWSPRTISSRGRLPDCITNKYIAVIGAGSLGASISELLLRAGVTHLICIDGDSLEIGNLCRHTLTMHDIGEYKSSALASRLLAINPQANIQSECNYLTMDKDKNIFPDISKCDIVIDTTGNDRVLYSLSVGLHWEKAILLSTSVGLGAKRLYLCLAKKHRPNIDNFIKVIEPYLKCDRDECAMDELPRDGIGCWHPLFPARSDDMWMAASISVKALDTFLTDSTNESLCAVYEATVINNLYNGHTPVEVKLNEL